MATNSQKQQQGQEWVRHEQLQAYIAALEQEQQVQL